MSQQFIGNDNARITPFNVHISDESLDQLDQLLSITPIAEPTYENTLLDGDRRFGMRRDWLTKAVEEWKTTFDWRKHEKYINTFDHFHMNINDELGDFHIHFVAMVSKRRDAVPLLLLHGWPGSFLDMTDDLPYHLVVPSLPGYAFSSRPPLEKDFGIGDVARLMNMLMLNLGYEAGYMVQGGDVGSKVARVIAAKHDECKGKDFSHDITVAEHKGLVRAREFMQTGSSYAIQHATKPATIGLVLSTNPIALLAWIGEKFLAWTEEDPPVSLILESVSLYWFTECAATSLWPYRIFYTPGVDGNPHNMSEYTIPADKPFGYSYYPYELYPVPKAWAAKTGNLTFFRAHDNGGHFAAIEQTEAFLKDLEEFVQESRAAAGFAGSV
ncbi:alpha/beta-hydrolase [Aureobasidium namibiae CBS 147.97]|uniref:Alpha/beta-hydrolase n=1 Tax=Aureobasidium namibiae CBS 147.97 TaxID=1043004 RepID=A0A074WM73_9PEZI|nr:alpha/beta-hydrolase [Aureobasidium namibiae CBS 147.97]KEQ74205.1 alpha/beta-hydrolase [Aureobasidium namibiae CBS 147.97]